MKLSTRRRRGGLAPRRAFAVVTLVLFGLALLAAGCGRGGDASSQYYCPMHPTYVSDRPGDCPICNMRLVPREMPADQAAREHAGHGAAGGVAGTGGPSDSAAGGATGHAGPAHSGGDSTLAVPGYATVKLDPERRRLAGVQTAVAVRQRLARDIRTVGIVRPDETLLQHVHVKVSGYVEKLHINVTGQLVQRGDPAFDVYSPELVASQEEFLRALQASRQLSTSSLPEAQRGAEELLGAARRRLELYDVPPEFIRRLERTGEPQRTITIPSHAGGYVVAKNVVDGDHVEPGMELLTVADLSRVWVEADFYENEAHLVRAGQVASLSLPYDPGRRLSGRMTYVYPFVEPTTRTLKVRFEFANPDLLLKPGMYADVSLEVEAREGVVVPVSAVLDTGERHLIFVELPGDRFEPRQVRTGLRGEGLVQVLSGVHAGESVVVRANFLLDSESRLRGAMGASPHAEHGGGTP